MASGVAPSSSCDDWVQIPIRRSAAAAAPDVSTTAVSVADTPPKYLWSYELSHLERPVNLILDYEVMFDRAYRAYRSPLIEMLQKHCYLRKGDPRPVTHSSFALASFHVSDELLEEFYEKYAYCLKTGFNMYFVERPVADIMPVVRVNPGEDSATVVEEALTTTRFMVDLDFSHIFKVTTDQMLCVCQVIQKVIAKFWPERDSFVVVSGAAYKHFVDKESKVDKVKTGAHLVWPRLFATLPQCFAVRDALVIELQETFGRRVGHANSVDSVVDMSIYGQSGLRLPGSRKAVKCSVCRAKRERMAQCTDCHGKGYSDEGRPYFPMFVLGKDSVRDKDREALYACDWHRLILDTVQKPLARERILPSETGFVFPPDLGIRSSLMAMAHAKVGDTIVFDKRVMRESERAHSHDDDHDRDRDRDRDRDHDEFDGRTEKAFKRSGAKVTYDGHAMSESIDTDHDAVEAFLRSNPRYPGIQVSKILKSQSKKHPIYVVSVRGPGSQFCMRKNAEHGSNHVYFCIEPRGCVQKCHSTKCADYESRVFPIPMELRALLFGNADAVDKGPSTPLPLSALSGVVEKMRLEDVRKWRMRVQSTMNCIDLVHRELGWSTVQSVMMQRSDLSSYGELGCDGSGLGLKGFRALRQLGFDTDSFPVPKEQPHVSMARQVRHALTDPVVAASVPSDIDDVHRALALAKTAWQSWVKSALRDFRLDVVYQ